MGSEGERAFRRFDTGGTKKFDFFFFMFVRAMTCAHAPSSMQFLCKAFLPRRLSALRDRAPPFHILLYISCFMSQAIRDFSFFFFLFLLDKSDRTGTDSFAM